MHGNTLDDQGDKKVCQFQPYSVEIYSNIPSFIQFWEVRIVNERKILWNERYSLMQDVRGGGAHGNVGSISSLSVGKRRIINEARAGRGQECTPWVVFLEEDLVKEFYSWIKNKNFNVEVNCKISCQRVDNG